MVEILAMASIIAPVTSGVVQAIKKASGVNKRYLPLIAIIIGILLGLASTFMNLPMVEMMWAGGISGLASVGLFELGKNAKEEDK